MAEVITLNQLLNDSSRGLNSNDFEQIELVRDRKLAKLKDRSAMIVTTCKHCVTSQSVLVGDHTTKVYQENEVPCPLCKKPANLPFPIFPKSTTENLAKAKVAKPVAVKDFLEVIRKSLLTSEISEYLEKLTPSDLAKINGSLASDSETTVQLFSKIAINQSIYNDMLEKAGSAREIVEAERLLLGSIIEMLLYSNIYGLPNSVSNFSVVYHNIFLALRVNLLTELASNSIDLKDRIQCLFILMGDFLSNARQANDSEEARAAFANYDLEKAYARFIVYLVVCRYAVLLGAERGRVRGAGQAGHRVFHQRESQAAYDAVRRGCWHLVGRLQGGPARQIRSGLLVPTFARRSVLPLLEEHAPVLEQ